MNGPTKLAHTAVGLAMEQKGVASRKQLIAKGISERAIGAAVSRGFLTPVYRGVFLVGRPQMDFDGLLTASLLFAGPETALGARTAARMWGFLDHQNPIHVIGRGRGRNFRARVRVEGESWWPYLMIHTTRELPKSDVTSIRGLSVTTPERTLRDCAAPLSDRQFRLAFIEADRLDLLNENELRRLAGSSRGHAKGGPFREMVERRIPNIGEARSLLEGIVLKMAADGLIPEPEVNRKTRRYRPDFRWRSSGVLVETDGYEFHRGREAFENDRLRANRLRAEGWTLLQFTWRQVTESPDEVVGMIRQAILNGRRRAS